MRDRRARRQRIKRYNAFIARLSAIRAEAYQLGLPHAHNHIAAALAEIVWEIRSKDWG